MRLFASIDESFEFIERTGQQYYAAELHRLKGELLLAQSASNASQAEQSFRDAIEIARKQHAKSWELRATTSFARLMRDRASATRHGRCSPTSMLVHRGLRHRRPEGREGAAARVRRVGD